MLLGNTKSVQMIKRFSGTERRYYMNQRGFNDFLKNIGLVNYPFNLYTAENEQEQDLLSRALLDPRLVV